MSDFYNPATDASPEDHQSVANEVPDTPTNDPASYGLDDHGDDGPSIDDVIKTTELDDEPAEKTEGEAASREKKEAEPKADAGDKKDSRGSQQEQQEGDRGPQDLTLSDGTVIKGGLERRMFEKAERYFRPQVQQMQTQMQQAQQQVREAQAQVKAYESAHKAMHDLGVTPHEANVSHQLMAAYKKDPVATINYLLTEAKAAGYDVSKIGGPGVDQAAIQRAIDNAVAPFVQDRQKQTQQRELQEQTQREYNAFVSRFPDAEMHGEEIARLMDVANQNGQQLTPDTAYYMLQSYFYRNGYDWSRPLSQQGKTPQQQQRVQTQQPSIPQGRPNQSTRPIEKQIDESSDWEDIIGISMAEAGMGSR